MTDLFAAKSAEPWRLPITKAHLRGAIWLLALAVFVLLPKPFADIEPAAAQVVAER
jgi:hypothetical protein